MGMTVYAARTETCPEHGTVWGPAIPFSCHNATIIADNWNELMDADLPSEFPNPDYVPHSSMDMSTDNTLAVFAAMGYSVCSQEGSEFPIEAIQAAAVAALLADLEPYARQDHTTGGNGQATFHHVGLSQDGIRARLVRLLALVAEGRARGATHIVVG